MTSGSTEQSSRNWRKDDEDGRQRLEMRTETEGGIDLQYSAVNSNSLCLVGSSATQEARMWEMSSLVLEQAWEIRQKPSLFLDHLLHRSSER